MLHHLLSVDDLQKSDIDQLMLQAEQFKQTRPGPVLRGRMLATAFFEPSTRTRLSFESAMQRLGGTVITLGDPEFTSIKKGETFDDTVRMLCGYADAIVIRHPNSGAAIQAAAAASIPIINAGDGANEHPTQALIDLFTIKECQGKLTELTLGFVGDLKFGRTIHSLAKALAHFPGNTIHLIAPPTLQLPTQYQRALEQHGIQCIIHEHLEEILPLLDILYMTRIQQERFATPEEYDRMAGVYTLERSMLLNTKPTMRILHPLPRITEISPDVDTDTHAYYFEQAKNAVFVRQAILTSLL